MDGNTPSAQPKNNEVSMNGKGAASIAVLTTLTITPAVLAKAPTCTVTSIRPASAEEVEHGHVHEDGDCEHDD